MLRPVPMIDPRRVARLALPVLTILMALSLPVGDVDAQQIPAAKQPPATTTTEGGTETVAAVIVRAKSGDETCRPVHFDVGAATLCVSSVLEPQSGNRYGGGNLTDGKESTAWVEGADGDGVGEHVAIDFEQPVAIAEILISNGYAKSRDIFGKNNRVRSLVVTTSDGKEQAVELSDDRDWQTLPVTLPDKTSWVMLTIGSVYRGAKYRDTAITGLDIR